MSDLDKVTVRAVGILADATARNVGSGSMVHLKLMRAQTIASQPALDAAGSVFDRLPGEQRAGIRTDAETQAHEENKNQAFDEVRDLYKGLAPIDGPAEKAAAAQPRHLRAAASERQWNESRPQATDRPAQTPDRPAKSRVGFGS
ncbi:MAG: hypothetical protein HYR63_26845 [Proteobacteria bacterium]|nr:hypothetical protein [Pseudomonadota bacterium]MBI3498842.1 hypothetical protein [Pseudomonadota bacterium]